MKNKKFYLTLVPTNECSLGCKYCYTIRNIHDKTRIKLEYIIKIMKTISKERKNIEILFIGGEPTSVGYEYFSKIMQTLIDVKKKLNLKLNFVMQTNGVLLDENWIKLFKKYNFTLGVSFDGFSKEAIHLRPYSRKLEENLQLLQKYNVKFGVLSVFNNETINDLLEHYFLMKKLKYNCKILPLNNNGYVEEKYILKFDENNHQKMEEFAKYWLYDKSCNIKMSSFHSMFYTLLAEEIPLCNSCIENRVSIRPDGSLYPCGRPYKDKYKIGHIDEIKEFSQFQENEGYKKLISLKWAKIQNCIGCKYFKVCHGGCVSNNILDNSFDKTDGFYCKYTKMVLDIFTPLVEKAKKDIKEGNIDRYNPILIKDLKSKGLI